MGERIDKHISARIPLIDDNSSELEKLYAESVNKHMIHQCRHGIGGCLNDKNICRYNYHITMINEQSTFDDKGFPQYKRLTSDDLNIVPHHRGILEDWEGIPQRSINNQYLILFFRRSCELRLQWKYLLRFISVQIFV
jgi:hypothetical protein